MKTFQHLIYVDPAMTGDKNFSGKYSPWDFSQRKEYLKRYATVLKQQYNLSQLPKKVVADGEVETLLKTYALPENTDASTLQFTEMDVYKREEKSAYLGWSFYTFGVKVEGGTLCFTDGNHPPVSAAQYNFARKGILQEISFDVYIEELQKIRQRIGITNVRGRVVELRNGSQTVVKVQIYPDGQIAYADGSKRRTHPAYVALPKAVVGWNTFSLKMTAEGCIVTVNGVESPLLPTYGKDTPDTLFLCEGMIPYGGWKVRLRSLLTDQMQTTDFFLPQEKTDEEEIFLGTQTLPYAIGTEGDKDCALIFRKRFDRLNGKHARLTVDSIDPCGLVYVNGKLVCKANDFLRKSVEIAEFLQDTDNLLEIVVCPRAPEVFYQWHRHTDPYNGWFCRGVSIDFYGDCALAHLTARTDAVGENSATVTLGADFGGKGFAKVWLTPIYPAMEERVCVDSFPVQGGAWEETYTLGVRLWDVDNPNLYKITIAVEDEKGCVFEKSIETGFRTIEQVNGEIRLNGKKVVLNGALSMQFLPPYKEIPINHLCPTDEQIVMQLEQVKRMNGNTLRMHFLGYGSNDERYARYADRMGCLLIWTTRLIDSAESVLLNGEWGAVKGYQSQIQDVKQYPSIIMWEGSNEAHVDDLALLDRMYDLFVDGVKQVDDTRLICPCSHLYYGSEIYTFCEGCTYYLDDGLHDAYGNPTNSSFGWTDAQVVRSAHTYVLLLGYGWDWQAFTTQDWKYQQELLDSKEHAYLVSEYAVIGRACPYVKEAKEYFNPNSYEFGDESAALGGSLSDEEYELSQAHQALCALYANKKMRGLGVDGMLWCCLSSGANDGSYLKPPIDFYGYAKFAFYTLKDCYDKTFCCMANDTPIYGQGDEISLTLFAEKGEYTVTVLIQDEMGNSVFESVQTVWVTTDKENIYVTKPDGLKGYYTVKITVEKKENDYD